MSLARQLELREYGTADNIRTAPVGSLDKACKPLAAGKLVIIDHCQIACMRKGVPRRCERAVDRHAVATPRLENAETEQQTALDELRRHRRTLAIPAVILHDDAAEAELGPLIGERPKSAPQ